MRWVCLALAFWFALLAALCTPWYLVAAVAWAALYAVECAPDED